MRALIGHPPLLAGNVLRATIVWAGIRLLVLLARGDLSGAAPMIGVALAVAVVCAIDAKATRESLFVRNLGIPGVWTIGVALVTSLALETLVRLT